MTDTDELAARIQAAIDADPLLARALRPRRVAGRTVVQLDDRLRVRLRRAPRPPRAAGPGRDT